MLGEKLPVGPSLRLVAASDDRVFVPTGGAVCCAHDPLIEDCFEGGLTSSVYIQRIQATVEYFASLQATGGRSVEAEVSLHHTHGYP